MKTGTQRFKKSVVRRPLKAHDTASMTIAQETLARQQSANELSGATALAAHCIQFGEH